MWFRHLIHVQSAIFSIVLALTTPLARAGVFPRLFTPKASVQSPGCGMQMEFLGTNPLSPFYPETHANYWTFSWEPQELGNSHAILLQGIYPKARFLSYTLYDGETGDVVSSLDDTQLRPDPVTPQAFGPGLAYSIWLSKENRPIEGALNQLTIPQSVRLPVLMLRTYVDTNELDPYAGVKLPAVSRIDLNQGKATTCPKTPAFRLPNGILKAAGQMTQQTELFKSPSIHFYRVSGAGFYPNPDNVYVATRLFFKDFGDVAVIRFRRPEAKDIGFGRLLRYQSFCMGSYRTGLTPKHGCLADFEWQADAQGMVTLVVSKDSSLGPIATAHKLNFLDAGTQYPLVLMRQLLVSPEYAGSLKSVREFDPTQPLPAQSADSFIGPWAPVGYYCMSRDFAKRGLDCQSPQ